MQATGSMSLGCQLRYIQCVTISTSKAPFPNMTYPQITSGGEAREGAAGKTRRQGSSGGEKERPSSHQGSHAAVLFETKLPTELQ